MNEKELNELRGIVESSTTFSGDVHPQYVRGYHAGFDAIQQMLREWIDARLETTQP